MTPFNESIYPRLGLLVHDRHTTVTVVVLEERVVPHPFGVGVVDGVGNLFRGWVPRVVGA